MSSFRKRNIKKQLPFTRTSPQTGQVITSSGNPSLDVILGGGLPIGSICLIEEDKFVTYSKVLAKYFMAEGVLSMQSVFLGSLDDRPKEMLQKLPKPLDKVETCKELNEQTEEEQGAQDGGKNDLRIAWRYNDLPMVNSEKTSTQIGHHFNLMEQIDSNMLKSANLITWSDDDSDNDIVVSQDEEEEDSKADCADNSECDYTLDQIFYNHKYSRLLKEIQHVLRDKLFHPCGMLIKRSLCRVCLTSLASPLWYDDQYGEDLLKFLTILRAAVRSASAVCFLSIPMHLVAKYDETLVAKIRNLVDFAIELESFAGSDKEANPAFKEYHGLVHLHKATAINTLSAYMPETTDLAFKLRRKKFVIEKLHLPPEAQDDSNQDEHKAAISCGTASSANCSLEF